MGRNAHIPAADTQQFIIEKTAALFNKKGISGTSLSDLEKETGLTKGSIYANFRDKEEVSIRVFEYNFNQLRNAIEEKTSQAFTAKGKLLATVDFYLGYYNKMASVGGCALQNALIESDDTNARMFEAARKSLKSWKAGLMDYIAEGIQQKEISRQTKPAEFAAYFIAVVEGAILVSRSLQDKQAFKAILNRLKEEIKAL